MGKSFKTAVYYLTIDRELDFGQLAFKDANTLVATNWN
jgi:hypothetical protein